jgi:cobalt-zinc-cadmium efflux system outer membrane protein
LSIAVTQTFEFPSKGTLRKAIANKNIEIAELGLEQFRLALAGQIRLLAYEHIAANSEAEAAEAVYRQSSELASQLTSQTGFGARLQIEIRLIQASLVELGAAIKESSLRREETRTKLNALLGLPQSIPLRLRDPLAPPQKRLNANRLVFAAQQKNPLLKIRQRELERSARELSAARLDIAPDFDIGPFFSRDVAGDTEQNIGAAISATVPLWDWNIGNIQSAKARREAAEALRVKAERDTEAEILSRLRAYELTQRQLDMIPSGLLQNVQGASALAETQFRNGSIGAQLYLDAQSASLNVLRSSQKAVLDAWRTLLDLNLLTGGTLETRRQSHETLHAFSGRRGFSWLGRLRSKAARAFSRRRPRPRRGRRARRPSRSRPGSHWRALRGGQGHYPAGRNQESHRLELAGAEERRSLRSCRLKLRSTALRMSRPGQTPSNWFGLRHGPGKSRSRTTSRAANRPR